MKSARPPLLHHTQPQPRPRHTRRPSPSLITLDESPTVARVSVSDPHRVAVATTSRPEAHAQHPARNAETAENRLYFTICLKIEVHAGRDQAASRGDIPPARFTYPRDAPRRGGLLRLLLSVQPLISHPSRSASLTHPTPLSAPLISPRLTPPLLPIFSTPSNSLSTHFHVPSSLLSPVPILPLLAHFTYVTPSHLSNTFSQ